MSSTSEEELTELFTNFGFDDKLTEEILKNDKISHTLGALIELADTDKPVAEGSATLLHGLASSMKGQSYTHSKQVVDYVTNGKIKSKAQVNGAHKYVKENDDSFDLAAFEDAAGVGQEVSDEQAAALIRDYFDQNKAEIVAGRYSLVPSLFTKVKNLQTLKWASPKLFKPTIDALMIEYVGPRDERDVGKKDKSKKKKKKQADTKKAAPVEESHNMFTEGFLGELHKPGEEPQMWDDVIAAHREFIQGQVYTRFPPEPNGFLHIGHSKAIMVNFGFAKYNGGHCYLRFDDTNPEAEEQVYFDSIRRCVKWLGYEPWKITYSSNYFDELYELAEKLITTGHGYVDHSTAEEVKQQRGIKEDGTPGGARTPSPWRDRPIEESLAEFRKMRDGFYKPGEATLRMKMDLDSPSPQMWDLVAYRVLNKSHPRTGDKWKIYPTYDFTHCLVDSFENITHSLCTTEFIMSRQSYEWLCDTLHVYRPPQREYGRLNITGTIMSKRKIAKLVNEHHVRSWDDPRLYTLESLRRRGVPPGAILTFINTLGVTTASTSIQVTRFESAVRTYLDYTTPRLMMIVDPIKVVLDNVADDFTIDCEMPFKPGNEEFGGRTLALTKEFYIDSSDYRDEAVKGYFRWAPEQDVGLMKVPFGISVIKVEKDSTGKPTLIHAKYLNDPEIKQKKPKAYIQWVPISKDSPVKVDEVRIYNQLFHSENPSANPGGFLADINPDSEEVIKGALIEPAFRTIQQKSPLNMPFSDPRFSIPEEEGPETVRFQGVRVGYFCEDKASTSDKIILNRIVTLKEDSSKD